MASVFKVFLFTTSFVLFCHNFASVSSLPFELFGSDVPRTGTKWPPFPWAGQDYWALQAGHYDKVPVSEVDKKDTIEVMSSRPGRKVVISKLPPVRQESRRLVPVVQYPQPSQPSQPIQPIQPTVYTYYL